MWKVVVVGLVAIVLSDAAFAAPDRVIKVRFDDDNCPASTRLKKVSDENQNAARCMNNNIKQADAVCAKKNYKIKWKGDQKFEIRGLPFPVESRQNGKVALVTIPGNTTESDLKYTIYGLKGDCELDPRIIIN